MDRFIVKTVFGTDAPFAVVDRLPPAGFGESHAVSSYTSRDRAERYAAKLNENFAEQAFVRFPAEWTCTADGYRWV